MPSPHPSHDRMKEMCRAGCKDLARRIKSLLNYTTVSGVDLTYWNALKDNQGSEWNTVYLSLSVLAHYFEQASKSEWQAFDVVKAIFGQEKIKHLQEQAEEEAGDTIPCFDLMPHVKTLPRKDLVKELFEKMKENQ